MRPAPWWRPRGRPRRHRRRRFSTLTLRILLPNVFALGILVGGLLYLDQYQQGLVEAKLDSLRTQAEIIAGALGESAVAGPLVARRLDEPVARQLVRRLAVPTRTRVRLFGGQGQLLADSRDLLDAGRLVQLRQLPPPGDDDPLARVLAEAYDWLLPRLPAQEELPLYREQAEQRAYDYAEAAAALTGDTGSAVRAVPDGGLVLSVATPVQQLRQVLGAVLLSSDGADIEESVRSVRVAILEVFALALTVSILLSVFLAGTIARPVRRLAQAADRLRIWRGQRVPVPDFSRRRDEIGDLSVALGQMAEALYQRIDAIEAFAADVAHELRNPLSSIRSAVETLRRTEDPLQARQLLKIIQDDVLRLDRLIGDIASASRVDAELAREAAETFDLVPLLRNVATAHRERFGPQRRLQLDLPAPGVLRVEGLPDRIAQVIENLIANAFSIAPEDSPVRVTARAAAGMAEFCVEDEGAGIAPEDRERIFERFYSRRPEAQRADHHSGLGLSIARQIIDAHGGTIEAENRLAPDGSICGARMRVRLPLEERPGH